ncbi:hypothetical protein JHK82_028078 [Glycine max]|uniref:Uncharacterized protein n=1 Tax=Glycine soja TaxID=3848 RepID=A0A0B2RE53_GLYSO|nr:hypothetical protein JHK87_027991 [Glycine soja]KAG4997303.1 hypothetical protein JHK85_028742 [Glycine max]KAG5004062.1 hypothetical protein JHK86_028201 [Glycine max]KAG5127243.1 hypothetical protein JHK82_028078 [Glycine max]KAG5151856.1 hypothetical protein JHK84_028328 [Glycine max]
MFNLNLNLDTVFACAVGVFEFVVGILPSTVSEASIFPNLLSVRISTTSIFAHRAASASAFAFAIEQKVPEDGSMDHARWDSLAWK